MNTLYFRKKYSIAIVILLAFLMQIPLASFSSYLNAGDEIVVEADGDLGENVVNSVYEDLEMKGFSSEVEEPDATELTEETDSKKMGPLGMPVVLGGSDFDEEVDINDEEFKKNFKITATKKIGGTDTPLDELENYRPKIDEEVDVEIEFTLLKDHKYGEGTKFTYKLPEPLKACEGEGNLLNYAETPPTTELGSYKISDSELVIEFNNNIRYEGDGGTGGLETKVWFNIKAKYELDSAARELVHILKLPGQEDITLYFTPLNGTVVEKSAKAENEGKSSSYVDWTVWANKVMDDLGDGGKEFKDTLAGNHTFGDIGDFEVKKYIVDPKGIEYFKEDVTGTFKAAYSYAKDNATDLILSLKDKFAYKITYRTISGDTENEKETLKNTATFNEKSVEVKTTIDFGPPLKKTVEQDGEKAKWTIKVNENRRTLGKDTKITDTWTSESSSGELNHKLEEGTFTVEGLKAEEYKKDLNNTGFTLTLEKDIKEPFTITYTTEPTDLVYEDYTITNEVERDDKTDLKDSSVFSYNQNVLKKTCKNPNYQDKTIDWEITINSAGYDMSNIVLDDVFVNENLSIVGDILVKRDGKPLTAGADNDYTFEDRGEKKGFELTINWINSKPITITYTTKYDVENVENVIDYKNTANLSWVTNGENYKSSVTRTTEVNTQQKDNGYKDGWYNYETKTFHWEVGFNYNYNKIVNVALLPKGQVLLVVQL